ncbi:hypothetical protein AB0F17_08820 [Nonomuraea sp. NPDC026600]|uniref:hypothetical protein n=1 Tax=Nonomuraea sp. NPDC026600 TaxID=3155363 RepID=UPI0034112607
MSAAPVNTDYRRDLRYALAKDIYTADYRNMMDAATAHLRRMAAVFEMYRIETEYERGGS